MKMFDTLIIGETAEDTNVDYDGAIVNAIGGAVYYSGFAAANIGHKIAVLPKADTAKIDLVDAFKKSENITVYPVHSPNSFVTKNVYLTSDREMRDSAVHSMIKPYGIGEIPDEIDAKIWHLAGLVRGDIPNELIKYASLHAMVALDVQTMLRVVNDGKIEYQNWKEKEEYFPYVTFLKTDAAEAEILTGISERVEAAKKMHSWGAREIMITHNTEVLIYDGRKIYTCPIKSKNLSGRTGRGDTAFAAYINERLTNDIESALRTATSLVSLKMETPGPFMGNRETLKNYLSHETFEVSVVSN